MRVRASYRLSLVGNRWPSRWGFKAEAAWSWAGMYGCASDPLKLAKMRALQREFTRCHEAGACGVEQEPGIDDFIHYSLKLFEHTWGGSTASHMNVTRTEVQHVWTADQLRAAQASKNFKFIEKLQATWDEQRLFLDKAVASLDGHGHSALSAKIRKEFSALAKEVPNAATLKARNLTKVGSRERGNAGGGLITTPDPLPLHRTLIAATHRLGTT